jgi:hypothetical protein
MQPLNIVRMLGAVGFPNEHGYSPDGEQRWLENSCKSKEQNAIALHRRYDSIPSLCCTGHLWLRQTPGRHDTLITFTRPRCDLNRCSFMVARATCISGAFRIAQPVQRNTGASYIHVGQQNAPRAVVYGQILTLLGQPIARLSDETFKAASVTTTDVVLYRLGATSVDGSRPCRFCIGASPAIRGHFRVRRHLKADILEMLFVASH